MKETIKKVIVFILTLEAKLVIKKYKPKIVAVTGSVGKTSTKDAIYTALLPFFHVRKSAKSFNSDIGIPLTILGLPNAWSDVRMWFRNIAQGFLMIIKKKDYPEWLVLEIGADHKGEIERVMKWIHPDISVITRIGSVPVHVEKYKSVKEVIREKSFLARGLKKEGNLILNADDEDVMSFKEFSSAKLTTFAIKNPADVKASFAQASFEGSEIRGTAFKVDINGSSIPVLLQGVLGNTHVYPVLAAFAVASNLGLDLLKVSDAFGHHEYPHGRMNIIKGINDSVLIDDTYNASPVAMEEGFKAIKNIDAKHKIGVVGDMLELGKFSQEEHERLGTLGASIFNMMCLVGIRARGMKDSMIQAGFAEENIFTFDTSTEVGKFLKEKIEAGDLVFIKGSQGMRMERAVAELMRDPKQKDKLLVRQEKEWVGR